MRKLSFRATFWLTYAVLFVSFIICTVVCLVDAYAATDVTFMWTPNTDNATGYSIVDNSASNTVTTVEGRETSTVSYTIEDDTKCHAFSIFATNGGGIRGFCGDFAIWCPPQPGVPGTFLITLDPLEITPVE